MPTQPDAPLEPSPAYTSLVLTPGVAPDGTVTALPSTPPSETAPLPPEPFADELPPDFWGDELEPPARQNAPDDPYAALSPSQPVAAKALEGTLEEDPRFRLLLELFPGRVTAWHAATPVIVSDDVLLNGADDAALAPETVDLERGLDADEAV